MVLFDKRFHRPGLAVLLILLAGCTAGELLQAPESKVKTYLLNAEVTPRAAAQNSDQVLLVATPRAESGFDTHYIAYSRDPLSLDYYTQSEWADTPAKMMLPLLVAALEKTRAFRAVVTPPTPAEADLRLEIDIIRLQQDFYQTPSQVRLVLRAKLFDPGTGRVLATDLFEAAEPAPSEDAFGGVQAANRALERLLGEVVEFVLGRGIGEGG